MDRLPKKFEDEVLNKHGIIWVNIVDEYFSTYTLDKRFPIKEYTLCAIGLSQKKYYIKPYGNLWEAILMEPEGLVAEDSVVDDFIECNYAAIKEIYG